MVPLARPAGMAPVFDAESAQLKAREGPYKGMISNPWVRQWTERPREGARATPGETESGGTATARARRAPSEESPHVSSDAGPAPRPERGASP